MVGICVRDIHLQCVFAYLFGFVDYMWGDVLMHRLHGSCLHCDIWREHLLHMHVLLYVFTGAMCVILLPVKEGGWWKWPVCVLSM